MRKTLKRLLCTAVATVAAVGTLMTVNVFAENINAKLTLNTDESVAALFDGALPSLSENGYVKCPENNYTNSSGITVFSNAFYYEKNIDYTKYGLKNASSNLISIPVSEKGNYTFKITVNSGVKVSIVGSSTGSKDYSLDKGENSIVYKKSSDSAETLTLKANGNDYFASINIIQSEYVSDEPATVKGTISGLDTKDTSATLSFDSGSALTISSEDYADTGISLVQGKTYSVTAVGNGGGIYKASGTITVGANATQTENIELSRISLDFPLEFTKYSTDLTTYIKNISSYPYTDSYSGITICSAPNTYYMSSHGIKATGEDLFSFVAENNGTYSFNMTATKAEKNETFGIKVDGELQGDAVLLAAKEAKNVTVTAKKGQTITISVPSHSDLYISDITCTYTAPEFTKKNGAVDVTTAAGTDGTDFYAIAVISKAKAENINSFEFGGKTVSSAYSAIKINGKEYYASDFGGTSDDYVYGFRINVTGGIATLEAIPTKVTLVISE